MYPKFPPKNLTGLSLVELLIGLAILVIIITSAAPNIALFIKRQHTIAELNELSYAIRMARHLAVDTQIPVSLCPAQDFAQCDISDWSRAKIIFHDRNQNQRRDNDEALLYGSMPVRRGLHLSGPKRTVIFRGNGSTTTPATFRLCPNQAIAELERALVISLQGRVRLSKDFNRDDIHELRPGVSIGCT